MLASEFMVEEHELRKEKIQEDYNDKYWDQRYTVVQRQIPSFLQKMAGKVLSTGEPRAPGHCARPPVALVVLLLRGGCPPAPQPGLLCLAAGPSACGHWPPFPEPGARPTDALLHCSPLEPVPLTVTQACGFSPQRPAPARRLWDPQARHPPPRRGWQGPRRFRAAAPGQQVPSPWATRTCVTWLRIGGSRETLGLEDSLGRLPERRDTPLSGWPGC